MHAGKNIPHLFNIHDYGKPSRLLYAFQASQMADIDLKNITIQEQKRVESLRLRGGRDALLCGQIVHKLRDAGWPDVAGMLFEMEEDVSPNPESVGLLRAQAQVAPAADRGDLIHETWGRERWRGKFTP